ncbi:T9SS type A sorting domain-containing protein [Carboxylicivirga taeanensis]|uniref:T9SS type A sorting domain-containing protein n=1 Tax=Carboxylicivirga taeanensis TaxID=1416875 RepID=UPI003F6DD8AF
MKRTITLLFLAIAFTSTFAQTVKIGSTSYSTINEAIIAASNNDVIDISGLHTESITIDKNITLRGSNPSADIIQAAADQISATSRVIYIDGQNGASTVTIQNLTVRNGNATDHGGGIYADKVTGLLSLDNVTIHNNTTTKNGGGISTGGSNVNFNHCTISNNSATGSGSVGTGGGLHIVPNNAAAIDAVVNVKNSLITNNVSALKTGGGFIVNGNHQYGDKFFIEVNFENVSVVNNTAEQDGGAGHIFGVDYTGTNGTVGETNVIVKIVHCTMAYNTSNQKAYKNGLSFANGNATTGPKFGVYNSVIVSADELGAKALDFAGSETIGAVNNIIGGSNAVPSLVTDAANNNMTAKTATFAGIASSLTEAGGKVKVLALTDAANSIDYCTAVTGITLPTTDARNYSRDASPDAGAYEYNGVSTDIDNVKELSVNIFPNPANDYFVVTGGSQINLINIHSLGGVLVKTVSNSNQVDVSGLTNGVYLVQVSGKNGETIKKLVVK